MDEPMVEQTRAAHRIANTIIEPHLHRSGPHPPPLLGVYLLRYDWMVAAQALTVTEITDDEVVTTRDRWPRLQFEYFVALGVLRQQGYVW